MQLEIHSGRGNNLSSRIVDWQSNVELGFFLLHEGLVRLPGRQFILVALLSNFLRLGGGNGLTALSWLYRRHFQPRNFRMSGFDLLDYFLREDVVALRPDARGRKGEDESKTSDTILH